MPPSGKAPRATAVFNVLAKPLLAAGLPMGPNGLLTVRGRTSGLPRTTPLAFIEAADRRWVWSPWGDVHWVRNLRAAGEATIVVHRHEVAVRAIELDAAERVTFVGDVLAPLARSMPGGRRFLRMLDGVDVDDAVATAEGRPMFELVPIGPSSPAIRDG